MKQTTNQPLKPLTVTEINTLCAAIKETKLTETQLRKFSIVDLWAIRKSMKPAAMRCNSMF